MQRSAIIFKAPFEIEIAQEAVPEAGPAQVLVETKFSAVSHGTEMLLYRGLFPGGLAVDETMAGLRRPLRYPLKYGYAAVGQVLAVGSKISRDWIGRRVFGLHPHESCFTAALDEIIPVPPDIDPLDALFLAQMETAVNLMMDGRPVIGEKAVVFGQGVVGLLTTALLARFPLAQLISLDPFEIRRQTAKHLGARHTVDPAIAVSGYDGGIVIGSWYGQRPAAVDLGGRFHRARIRLISSQVSTLTPALSGRWSKARRLDTAWDMIRSLKPGRLITHRMPLSRAREAYALIDRRPAETLQVVLDYAHG